jgi:ribose transport system permease protein
MSRNDVADRNEAAPASAVPDRVPEPDAGHRAGRRLLWRVPALDRFAAVYVLVVLVVVFSLLRPDTFATADNFWIIVRGEVVSAMLALALILPLSGDVFDISLPATMGGSAVLVCWLQVHGVDTSLAVLLTLVAGAFVGAINGALVVWLKINPLIATLGMMSVLGSLAFALTGGLGVYGGLPASFKHLGQGSFHGMPVTAVYVAVVGAIVYYVLEHTVLGRHIRATGASSAAARLAGVRVARIKFGLLVAGATTAAAAGVMYAARLGSGPLDAGTPFLLSGFAAAFLGATQVRPGRFNVAGTLIAIYVVATGVTGLQLVFPGNAWLKQFFEGAVLIVAVALSKATRAPMASDVQGAST